MPAWNQHDLTIQFNRAKTNNWLDSFTKAATTYTFPIEILLGVASRETNMNNIIGDGGHGYGIMQIDDRSFPEWCQSGQWKNVDAAIDKGAFVLDLKRQQVIDGQGKDLEVGGVSFHGASDIDPHDLLRISLAAYNSGLWAYYSFSQGLDPDARTTGHDYSADTLKRAEFLKSLLP
jgi:hypothetical protein